jgi:hypothetical protein
MTTTAVFALEIASSFLIIGLAAWWYAWPRLTAMRSADALSLLLFIHCFRTIGVSLLVPAAGIDIPVRAAQEIGYGDLAAALLALISIVALRYRPALSRPIIWVFSIVGMLDLANAQYVGVLFNLLQHTLGPGWYIVTYFVPLLWVTHVLIVLLLVKQRRGQARG